MISISRKETMYSFLSKAVSEFKDKKFKNIEIEVCLAFKNGEPVFGLTVFDANAHNQRFSFYAFEGVHQNKKKFKELLSEINKDSLPGIVEFYERRFR